MNIFCAEVKIFKENAKLTNSLSEYKNKHTSIIIKGKIYLIFDRKYVPIELILKFPKNRAIKGPENKKP